MSMAFCPHDGGTCHHSCTTTCFRKDTGMALTEPWPGYPRPGNAPVVVHSAAIKAPGNERFMDEVVLRVVHLFEPWQSWNRSAWRCQLCGDVVAKHEIEAHAFKHIDALVRNSPHHAAAWAAWQAGDEALAVELAIESQYVFKTLAPQSDE